VQRRTGSPKAAGTGFPYYLAAIRITAKGYSLFREDNGKPVARLRPIGRGNQVEVLWCRHRDRWDQIGDFGPMVMPLDEALDFIANDSMGCFWH